MTSNDLVFPRHPQPFNHVSFSFQNLKSEQLEPRKSIDQYLRLKTNESIQQKGNIQPKRSLCLRKSMKGSEADPDSEYQMQLRNQENSLRMESLTKQYQLKLAKQEQFFSLREWKLKEEIENLNHQVNSLTEEVKRLRSAGKQHNAHCSLCSDGQVIAHLNKVLKEVEDSHKNCLQSKKEMRRQLDNNEGQLEVMEQEHDKLYQQSKALNKQLRALNHQIHQFEQENTLLKESVQSLKNATARKQAEWQCKQSDWQSRQSSYEQSLDDLRKRLALMERMERREEESMANSKATAHSVLTNIENNMNTSFIKSKSTQKPRTSLSKVVQQADDHLSTQNPQYIRKMNEYSRTNNSKFSDMRGGSSKMQNLKWKFF